MKEALGVLPQMRRFGQLQFKDNEPGLHCSNKYSQHYKCLLLSVF